MTDTKLQTIARETALKLHETMGPGSGWLSGKDAQPIILAALERATEELRKERLDILKRLDLAMHEEKGLRERVDKLRAEKATTPSVQSGGVPYSVITGNEEDWRLWRTSWMMAILNRIDEVEGAFEMLAGDDPDSLTTAIAECKQMAKECTEFLRNTRAVQGAEDDTIEHDKAWLEWQKQQHAGGNY